MDRAFRDVVRRSMSLAHVRSSPKPVSASEIRKSFIDYFCESNKHLYIRSSPVFSLKDPTLAFTNAGMNQFKDVFLGFVEPASKRVANSQKCIRIGGAHNDLSQVGKDGTHHTFFEMLGNWSFGDYFKEETCRMSWDLLTNVYGIPPERLYVTYFGGDEALGLKSDEEVLEIWRQIGVKESHILAFGTRENFWAGSLTGPCGPCTEIHYDHCPGRTDAGTLVNSGSSEVTELWNLVFTQFDRKSTGELTNLKKHFVDTGMGLERLVAVLQGKTSNYDTDLFLPLFDVIKKQTGHSGYTGKYDGDTVDCSYRILADHSRMITVALSDGMIPNQQKKVRGILKKMLAVAEKIFGAKPDLLKELTSHVAEILSDSYPEIGKNLSKIHYIIDNEVEMLNSQKSVVLKQWKKMKNSYPDIDEATVLENPKLLTGLEYLSKNILNKGKNALTAEEIFVLFDTHGVPVHVMKEAALKLGVGFDMDAYLEYERSKKATDRDYLHGKYVSDRTEILNSDFLSELENRKIPPTNDYFKYDYRVDSTGQYIFKNQNTTIEAILHGSELVDEIALEEIKENEEVGLVLDRTQLFAKEGGQESDKGTLEIERKIIFDVERVVKIKEYAIHFGVFRKFPRNSKLTIGDLGVLQLDKTRRLNTMRNHTALHLLTTFLRNEFFISGEKSSHITPDKLSLQFMLYEDGLHPIEGLEKMENYIKNFITHGVSVKTKFFHHPLYLTSNDVIFTPGEPLIKSDIPVVEINSGFKLSREYCTGTHLLNTSDLKDFVVTKFLKGSSRVYMIEGVTGAVCEEIRKADSQLEERWRCLKEEVPDCSQLDLAEMQEVVRKMKEFLNEVKELKGISQLVRNRVSYEANEVRKEVAGVLPEMIRDFLKKEVLKAAEDAQERFVVLSLERCWDFSPDDLEAAVEELKDKAVLVLLRGKQSVAIQCIVPKEFVSENFSARHWLTESAITLGGIAKCTKKQNPDLVYYLEDFKAKEAQLDLIEKEAVRVARESLQMPTDGSVLVKKTESNKKNICS